MARRQFFQFRFELFHREVMLEQGIGQAPRLEDRLGEDRAGIARFAGAMRRVAANADQERHWQIQVVDEIPQSIARLKQAGALHNQERVGTPKNQARGDGNRFAFASRPNQLR